jgi:hypothetical protein
VVSGASDIEPMSASGRANDVAELVSDRETDTIIAAHRPPDGVERDLVLNEIVTDDSDVAGQSDTCCGVALVRSA